MINLSFQKYLFLLSQPLSVLAILILLVNDHLLRKLWPSWWTGKLGDFAWLFFAPFVLAALIALLFPYHPKHEKIIGWISFGLIGCVFTLAKTLFEFNSLLVRLTRIIIGIPVKIVVDPTDLIALVSLLFGFWLWQRNKNIQLSFPKRGWIVLTLAALTTVANAAMADYGIDCLALQDRQIKASSSYWTYISTNGGLSWQASSDDDQCSQHAQNRKIVDFKNQNILYQFTPGTIIERSIDGGKSWQTEFRISSDSQAKLAYYEKAQSGSPVFRPGPLDAIIDPSTGNIIFAMGHEGVLIRQPNGSWVWISIGGYHHVELTQVTPFITLLWGEMLLTIFLGMLLISTWALFLNNTWLKILGVISWMFWFISTICWPPALMNNYIAAVSGILLITTGLFSVPTGIAILIILIRNAKQKICRILIHALFGALLFFIPYSLWAINFLRSYTVATVIAIGLSIVNLLLGFHSIGELSKSGK